MKVLITGASGFLGTRLMQIFSLTDEVVGCYYHHQQKDLQFLDIGNKNQTFKKVKEIRPDLVVHTAALIDVDWCQLHSKEAFSVNYEGTKNLVEACGNISARLEYISTMYVFDGVKGEYTEEDIPNPLNVYGETKLLAEKEVRKLPNWGIYRPETIYGYNGQGNPNYIIDKILSGKPYEVNNEQIRQPILADDIAEAIRSENRIGSNGIFHLAGPDRVTKYELTRRLSCLFGKEGQIIPVGEKEQLAPRPKNVTVDTTKARSLGLNFTSLQEGLLQICQRLTIEGAGRGKERI